MKMDFDTTGFEQARAEIQAMRRRAGNLIPAWQAFLSWWAVENRKHWSSRGTRWRTPWKPLAPITVEAKRRAGYPSAPLVRTGALRRDLTVRPLGFERMTQQTVEAGTRIAYAHFHQGGTRHMPARKLVNARAVTAEGAASGAIVNWIVNGRAAVPPGQGR